MIFLILSYYFFQFYSDFFFFYSSNIIQSYMTMNSVINKRLKYKIKYFIAFTFLFIGTCNVGTQ